MKPLHKMKKKKNNDHFGLFPCWRCVKRSFVYTNGLCINWLRWIVCDYVVIRSHRNRTGFYSQREESASFTLAASQHYGSAPYVPKVFHAYWSFSYHEEPRLNAGLKRPLEFAVHAGSLCSPGLRAAAASQPFARCWSGVASSGASSASGCSAFVSSRCLSFVSNPPWWFSCRRGIWHRH